MSEQDEGNGYEHAWNSYVEETYRRVVAARHYLRQTAFQTLLRIRSTLYLIGPTYDHPRSRSAHRKPDVLCTH